MNDHPDEIGRQLKVGDIVKRTGNGDRYILNGSIYTITELLDERTIILKGIPDGRKYRSIYFKWISSGKKKGHLPIWW